MMNGDIHSTGEDGATIVPSGWRQRLVVGLVSLVGHLVGVGLVGVALASLLLDYHHLRMYLEAVRGGLPVDAGMWVGHVALSALLWSAVVVAFRLIRDRLSSEESPTLVRPRRGAVLLETLIVLVPFLLLTSGLAQLAIRNVAGLLADVALYQGARSAWVWEPERGESRSPLRNVNIDNSFVETRARLASAMALAPTAPSSFRMEAASPDPVDKMRAAMFATYSETQTQTPNLGSRARGNTNFNGSSAEGEQLSFAQALDSGAMDHRAGRKLQFAYLSFSQYDINYGVDSVGVQFTYQLNVTFPWFAYIFGGGLGDPARTGRRGWYTPIRRPRPDRPGDYFRLQMQADLPNLE